MTHFWRKGFYILSVDTISAYCDDIFNAILNCGRFPVIWTKSILVPLFKKNDGSDVNNYRSQWSIRSKDDPAMFSVWNARTCFFLRTG